MHSIIDLHCDLLSYLSEIEDARPTDALRIGCASPWLRAGGVKVQVLPTFVPTGPGSVDQALRQCRWYRKLSVEYPEHLVSVNTPIGVAAALESHHTGIVFAIENASALCTESEPVDLAFERLDDFGHEAGRILYITLTHHTENRFGGGNQTDIGLKDDGRTLLEFLHGRRIAVDLSHTSDELARGILRHLDNKGLDVPVLASHSNFRSVLHHPRNLSEDLAREIVQRGGVIGLNFVRAFVDPHDPSALKRHVLHAFEIGAGEALCFGADFFFWKNHPDKSGLPFFHEGQEHAGRYPSILEAFGPELGFHQQRALAFENAIRFMGSVWG